VNVSQFVDWLQSSRFGPSVTSVQRISARPARFGNWPETLSPRIVEALARRGIERPFSHQAAAIARTLGGEDVVVVTPTASGKTLCYNAPVLQTILADPEARALYLFPTKALAQDQLAELRALVDEVGASVGTFTYDGDTPSNARRAVRQAGHIVVSNPDMLHSGILPHHTQWRRLFSSLRYVVVDELHVYRGVFGSHVANVLRRLQRICAHYGSSPRFILCSASIANPRELAERLIDRSVALVDDNGAPSGEKYLVLYNPPVVDRALGIRTGSVTASRRLAGEIIGNRIHTIVFARSRLVVELLLRYLRSDALASHLLPEAIQGYRGGYLPLERRTIERGLRERKIQAVVSTNALELGIDIGSLEACVMVGYPGTVASTLQQMGRAGRRDSAAVAIVVAASTPLDQYVVNHPEYLLGAPSESGLINPDNLLIYGSHVKCAAFELPFRDGEEFGRLSPRALLESFEADRMLYKSGDRWFWSAESFPSYEISLRTATAENVVIVDQTDPSDVHVIGEMDRPSAATMLHDEAIYLHAGQQYEVIRLDWEEKKAFVRSVEVDYYTTASLAVRLAVLDQMAVEGRKAWGEVGVTYLATIYKKLRLETHENVGWGRIRLPEDVFHTTAVWISLPTDAGRLTPVQIEGGLSGLAHVLANVAPLYVMCDPRDLGVVAETRSTFTGEPSVFIYDVVPGGVGFSERLFGCFDQLVSSAEEIVAHCPCANGCPSCVGAPTGDSDAAKAIALSLLHSIHSTVTTR
jgi:DEAD/DEAH box helicase domain-containing protein